MPKWFRKSYQRWAYYQLNRRGYLDLLSARPPDAFPPDFSDLWFLYKLVRERKPHCILEFGSGCSTIILAQAVWENERNSSAHANSNLYSLDADPYWTEVTRKTIPPYLQKICHIIHSSLLAVDYLGAAGWRHANVPDITPDFIYLDGPALTPGRQVVVDVLDMEKRFLPGFFMIVDGRRENTAFLLKHLKKRYIYRYRHQFRNSVFELIS